MFIGMMFIHLMFTVLTSIALMFTVLMFIVLMYIVLMYIVLIFIVLMFSVWMFIDLVFIVLTFIVLMFHSSHFQRLRTLSFWTLFVSSLLILYSLCYWNRFQFEGRYYNTIFKTWIIWRIHRRVLWAVTTSLSLVCQNLSISGCHFIKVLGSCFSSTKCISLVDNLLLNALVKWHPDPTTIQRKR